MRHTRTIDKITSLDKDTAEDLVQKHDTIKAILIALGIDSFRATTYDTLRARFDELGVDHSRILRGIGWITKNGPRVMQEAQKQKEKTNKELFVAHSSTDRGVIKRRILRDSLIPYVCKECGQEPFWNGKPLTLILDHINGVNNDHRLDNLRFLCPHCNIQMDTFGSKKLRIINHCETCDAQIIKTSRFCDNCRPKWTKIKWPPKEELQVMVDTSSYVAVGKLLGVSDNAVRKHLKK
jgi:hypothetical protein